MSFFIINRFRFNKMIFNYNNNYKDIKKTLNSYFSNKYKINRNMNNYRKYYRYKKINMNNRDYKIYKMKNNTQIKINNKYNNY